MKAAWPTAATTNQKMLAQRRAVEPALSRIGDEDGVDMDAPDTTSELRPSAGMAAARAAGLADLELG